MQIIRILQNGFCFAMRFYILSGWEKIDFSEVTRAWRRRIFVNVPSRRSATGKSDATEKRRTIKNSDAPAPRLLSRWSEWETEKVRADTQKTHGNAQKAQKKRRKSTEKRRENAEKTQRSTRKTHGSAQEVQKAQKTQKKYRKRRNHTAREMKRRDGQGGKNAVHDETLL